jgi:hypothetical protein
MPEKVCQIGDCGILYKGDVVSPCCCLGQIWHETRRDLELTWQVTSEGLRRGLEEGLLDCMRMRHARRIDVKIDFQGLFGRFKNEIAGRALCKMLRDLALNGRRQPAFEVIANQSDGFLAVHKVPLTHHGQSSSQAK